MWLRKDFATRVLRSFLILDRFPGHRDFMCAIRAGTSWRSSRPLCNSVSSVVMIDFSPQRTQRRKLMSFKIINPESLGAPRGYSNGVLAESGGKLLFVAGQVAWDQQQQIVSADLVEQFDRALANVVAVVTEAGGEPKQIARLVIYVTDQNE